MSTAILQVLRPVWADGGRCPRLSEWIEMHGEAAAWCGGDPQNLLARLLLLLTEPSRFYTVHAHQHPGTTGYTHIQGLFGMRTLGIDIVSSDLHWIILDGTRTGGSCELLPRSTVSLPQSAPDTIGNLLLLKDYISTVLKDKTVEAVGVIRADSGSSPLRAKIECMVEYASKDANIPCDTIPVQTVRAAEARKVVQVAGRTLEQAFFAGNGIHPKYLTKAAYCAWSIINASIH